MKRKIVFLLLILFSLNFSLPGAKYLIITHDNFYNAIQPLAQWKHKKGAPVKTVKLSEIAATPESIGRIKNYIVNAYNTWNPHPEYILLVGSTDYIHSDGYDCYDDYYGNITGDYHMELSVGRFAANTVLQCSTMVAKTLYYERTPYVTDPNWFKKGTGMVTEDGSTHPDTVYWNDVRFAYNQWRNAGYTHIDSFSRLLGNNGTNVVNAINDGRAFLIYRGQAVGTWGSYGADPFTVNPNTCTNGKKLPVVISPTCATLSLYDDGYQGNLFLNAGTPQNPKGAVAYCATTNAAGGDGLARCRGLVGQGIYKAIFQENLYKLGDALKRGKFFADSIHPNSMWSSTRYREWNMLGDPELNCWTTSPQQLTVTHDTLIYAGNQIYTITVKVGSAPLAGALVCVMMDTTIYQYNTTNSSGQVSFSIAPPLGTMSVTVTAHNDIPYEKNVTVRPNGLAHDVSLYTIYEPNGTIASGTNVYPKVKIKNYGSNTETFPVTFKIGSVYTHTDTVTALAANDTLRIIFPVWTAVEGSYSTKAWTNLSTDQWRNNDTAFGSITILLPHDVGVTTILAPSETICQGQIITPQAIVTNYGASSETFSAVFKIETEYNQTISSISLGSGITDTIEFPDWISSVGTFSTQCYTQLAIDNNRTNDTVNGAVYVGNYYQENFETSNGSFTANPLSNAWEWGTPASGPGTAHTGAKLWATILNGNYTDNADWKLTSRKFEALQNNPVLRFWHWYNTELYYDGGNVKISTDGGNTWGVILPQEGYTGTASASTQGIPNEACYMGGHTFWEQATFVLPVTLGQQFYLRWHFGSDIGLTYEGWYIDDISCTGFKAATQFPHDVSVISILAPKDTIAQEQIITPKAIIANYGASAETFSAKFKIGTIYTDSLLSINLGPDMTDTIDFPDWNAEIGSYATTCWTQLASDNNRSNDTAYGSVYVGNYYLENFEASNGTYIAAPAQSAWEWGVPTSGPNAAYSGTNLWATVLAGDYIDYADWKLTSREYIATADNPTLKFWHWYNMEESPGTPGRAYDGGNVKISTDSTATWILISPTSGYNGVAYSTNVAIPEESCYSGVHENWQEAIFSLPVNAGQRFFLRWHFGSDNGVVRSGWYLDDIYGISFTPYYGIGNDVSSVSIQAPVNSVDSGAVIMPSAIIHNHNLSRVSFDVKFDISDGYTSTQTISAPANSDTIVSFALWTARYFGTFNTKCSTRYTEDLNPSNDKLTGTVRVRFYDVGAYEIASPQDTQILASLPVVAKIKNYYTRTASCSTRFIIRDTNGTTVFNQVYYDSGMLPESIRTINFGDFSGQLGKYYTQVYTKLAFDDNPANDTISDWFVYSLAAPALTSPSQSGTLRTQTPFFDWEDVAGALHYHFQIDNDIDFSSPNIETVIDNSSQYQVPAPGLSYGVYYWRVCAGLPYSYWSDVRELILEPTLSWIRINNDVPSLAPGKGVKDGGALVAIQENLYAFRGNKSNEFYFYNDTSWIGKESMPYGKKPNDPWSYNKKKVAKGGASGCDGANTIYAIKGNNTREFWAYEITNDLWTPKAFVPTNLKGGSSLAYYNGKAYLLAGGQKRGVHNFYIYDIVTNVWTSGADIELGPFSKLWRDGSCVTVMDSIIYALKGGDKYNAFFAYNVTGNSWSEIESIPIVDNLFGKSKKVIVKDGGAITSGDSTIYAIKGGGANVLWKYTTSNGWTSLETIPRLNKKSVPKSGAAMAYANRKVYLLKGNNTIEFWQYVPSQGTTSLPLIMTNGIMTQPSQIVHPFRLLENSPNPFKSQTAIRYSLPAEGKILLQIYNITGRSVKTLVNANMKPGVYSVIWNGKDEQGNKVASGVYFYTIKSERNAPNVQKKMLMLR